MKGWFIENIELYLLQFSQLEIFEVQKERLHLTRACHKQYQRLFQISTHSKTIEACFAKGTAMHILLMKNTIPPRGTFKSMSLRG